MKRLSAMLLLALLCACGSSGSGGTPDPTGNKKELHSLWTADDFHDSVTHHDILDLTGMSFGSPVEIWYNDVDHLCKASVTFEDGDEYSGTLSYSDVGCSATGSGFYNVLDNNHLQLLFNGTHLFH